MNLPLVVYQRSPPPTPPPATASTRSSLRVFPDSPPRCAASAPASSSSCPAANTRPDDDRRAVFAGAAVVVTDDCPRAAPPLAVQLIAVDSSCIVPMNAIPARSYAAYAIRPKIHKLLAQYLRAGRLKWRCAASARRTSTDCTRK